jgi:hypothetical protein
VSRIVISLKKKQIESTLYGVENARKASNLAAPCALSGAEVNGRQTPPATVFYRKRMMMSGVD